MAYDFISSSNRSYTGLATTSRPITIAARMRTTNFSSTRVIGGMVTAGDASQNQYIFTQRNFGTALRFRVANATQSSQPDVTSAGANTWLVVAGVESGASSRRVYADNTVTTNTSTLTTAPTVDTLQIGTGIGGTVGVDLAEFAVWDVALTADEINSLVQGFKPFRVRPQSLVYYVPLVRDVNELCDSLALTTSATAPTVIAHPRVY